MMPVLEVRGATAQQAAPSCFVGVDIYGPALDIKEQLRVNPPRTNPFMDRRVKDVQKNMPSDTTVPDGE
jgi:hypothetical protein